ncbi:MAG: FeoB-associated Cys-rich membrane protein [Bacteroidales bacterium]|nr:FeoB-associated Cys-rich membrane protein [Bacteroidales bacterium]
MIQTVIVGVIVATALFFAGRRITRTVKGKGGCGCGCDSCPYKGDCNKKEADT